MECGSVEGHGRSWRGRVGVPVKPVLCSLWPGGGNALTRRKFRCRQVIFVSNVAEPVVLAFSPVNIQTRCFRLLMIFFQPVFLYLHFSYSNRRYFPTDLFRLFSPETSPSPLCSATCPPLATAVSRSTPAGRFVRAGNLIPGRQWQRDFPTAASLRSREMTRETKLFRTISFVSTIIILLLLLFVVFAIFLYSFVLVVAPPLRKRHENGGGGELTCTWRYNKSYTTVTI